MKYTGGTFKGEQELAVKQKKKQTTAQKSIGKKAAMGWRIRKDS